MSSVVAIVVDGVWVPVSDGRRAIEINAGNDSDMTNSYTQEQREIIHRKAKAMTGQQLPATDGHCAVDARNNSDVMRSSTDEVDQIVGLLGQIVRRTKSLSAEDALRVREFIRMTQAVLTATTCLPAGDQRAFEAALRDAARMGY
jgi:hypothetical protein